MQKEVGGENGLKKLIELYWNVITAAIQKLRYIERMYMIWKVKGMFDVKEQRLLNQKRYIVTKKWFPDLELN